MLPSRFTETREPVAEDAASADVVRRRRRNQAHIIRPLLAMGALLGFCGWIVAGWDGILLLLAFSLGEGETAGAVIADSLLSGLTPREPCGILAHEIINLHSGDITLKQLGFVLGWLTRMLSQLGFVFLFVAFLLHVFSLAEFPLLSVLVPAAAPLTVNPLRPALSRARETEADLDAAELTGDPAGLASALVKLRRWQESNLRQLFPTGRSLHLPTLFTDHPPIEERIRSLNRLAHIG